MTYTAWGAGDPMNVILAPSGEKAGSVLAAEMPFVRFWAGPVPLSSIE